MGRKKVKRLDRHHRKCRSNGGNNNAENISLVTQKQHRAWHLLFQNRTPAEIARVITEVWIAEFYLVAIPYKKKSPKARRVRKYCIDCECEVLKHIPITQKV